jgi:DNA-binding CsgD family transcriptional regulator
MRPTNAACLERARQSFEQKRWADARRLFEAAERDAALGGEDAERRALSAYLMGRDDESEAAHTRAHQAFLDRGDTESAARSATWLGFVHLHRGALAPASGWFARAARLVDDAGLDSVVRGYVLIPSAIQQIVQGDSASGLATFERAAEIARRFGDRDLASIACHGRGRALIRLGDIRGGVALLDEAMAAVIAGEVSPAIAGDVYCGVLEGCQETFDVGRAYEWTVSLVQWCANQPGLVRYQGECLLYRAEVMQLRGEWSDAARDAQRACELLGDRPIAGSAFYRVGEIHRLRGEHAKAETAYAQANQRGCKPQPGLALLRLAQGQVDAAAASIRGVLLEARTLDARARVLAAAVEILMTAGDVDAARDAADELSRIAAAIGAPLLETASEHASGAVRLTAGDTPAAAASLERAREGWRALSMPYEEAQVRLLLAKVCERRSDPVGRDLELEAARRLLSQLDAPSPLARLAVRTPGEPAGTLSPREVQVLRLLATGRTNRDIGKQLVISEKTVARHVSNLFDKLGVSSRAAAVSLAHQRNLL